MDRRSAEMLIIINPSWPFILLTRFFRKALISTRWAIQRGPAQLAEEPSEPTAKSYSLRKELAQSAAFGQIRTIAHRSEPRRSVAERVSVNPLRKIIQFRAI